jgi:hypothetical protein
MRLTSGLILPICLASLCLAACQASPPPAAQSPAASATRAAPATAVTGAAPTAASTSASSSSGSIDYKEKALLARGYKVHMRGGQRVLCKAEAALGTRFSTETCDTADNLYARMISDQQNAIDVQRRTGMGGVASQ